MKLIFCISLFVLLLGLVKGYIKFRIDRERQPGVSSIIFGLVVLMTVGSGMVIFISNSESSGEASQYVAQDEAFIRDREDDEVVGKEVDPDDFSHFTKFAFVDGKIHFAGYNY